MTPSKPARSTPDKQPGAATAGIALLASLRARLSLIIILASIPAAFFLLFDALAIRQQVRSEAQTEIARLTHVVADSYGKQVEETQRLLAAIALFPEVQTGDAAACSARLAQMVALYQPQYQGFGVSNLNGEMFCTSASITPTVQIADRLWFRDSVRTKQFAIGEYAIARPSGLPTLGLGYPVLDQNDNVTRVVSHALLLSVLQAEANDLPLPADAVLTIADRNGVILARVPDSEQWVGRRQPIIAAQAPQQQGASVVTAIGEDGGERLYALTPIPGPSGAQVWLSIGRPPAVVYAPVGQTILRDLIGIGIVLLMALAALWLGSNRLLLGRIDQLVGTSTRLAAGDWQARAPVRARGDELDKLALTFNQMADTLHQRQTELAERERHLDLALQAARMVAWTWDPRKDQIATTDSFAEVYGLSPIQYAEQGFALLHPDDRERHSRIVTQAAAAQTPYHSEFRIIRPDNGQTVWLDERAVPIFDTVGNLQEFAGVVIDITERKQVNLALREARDAAEAAAHKAQLSADHIAQLQSVTAALASALTPDQVLEVILLNGASALNAAALSVKLLSADGQWLESGDLFDYPAAIKAAYQRYPLSARTPIADAARSGEPIWLESQAAFLEYYPHLDAVIDELGLGAVAALPLVLGDQVMGAIGISFAADLQFDAQEREYLLTLANQCTQALERARLYAAEQQARTDLETRVRERTAELERSNRELNQFAYVASHDLKAPLRAIDNLANWISEDAARILPPRSAEHLLKLRGRVKRMEKLLDDLLAYSRAGRTRPPVEPVDLNLLVQDIVGVLAPPSGFIVTVEPPALELRTPRVSLELVLRNLIGNAIKHHDQQSGQIHIYAVAQGDWVEFTVRDDGPGIEPQYHERIFEMYQTLRPRDQTEGSGMGLTIVKKLIESYGGTITVTSTPGQGATFRFTWPRWLEAADAPA
jgi:PAS domain S-box-containing protein